MTLRDALVLAILYFTAAASRCTADESAPLSPNYVAVKFTELNDNGAWSWFMDERAIVDRGKLIVGSVRAVGKFDTGRDDPDWGNVEIAVMDVASGETRKTVLARHYEQDDHNNPAYYVREDGRYLAVFTKHGSDQIINYSLTEAGDPLAWGGVRAFAAPERDPNAAKRPDSVTYSNLFRFPDGKLYDFHRGLDHDPNYIVSRDEGETWEYGGRLMRGRDGYCPYLKYAYDGAGTLHFVATEDHPRHYDNSLYHGFLRDGVLYRSDGRKVGELSTSADVDVNAWDFTKVFAGDADNVAWMADIELDEAGRPYVLFTVQVDGRGLPPGQGGMDLRYYYARFDGQSWNVHEAAFAGHRLYPHEDDYSGLAALDPQDPDAVFISTSADPTTGAPLVSAADGQRHYELYYGRTSDGGATWRWTPITANSTVDNLRPIMPKWDDARRALVWMRGTYRANRGEWTTAVVAAIMEPAALAGNPDNAGVAASE